MWHQDHDGDLPDRIPAEMRGERLTSGRADMHACVSALMSCIRSLNSHSAFCVLHAGRKHLMSEMPARLHAARSHLP